MVYPREILNRLKWMPGEQLDEAVVCYVHRGAPRDLMTITGDKIRSLGRAFFETDEATIPYHRIVRIEYRGELLFHKPHVSKVSKDRRKTS